MLPGAPAFSGDIVVKILIADDEAPARARLAANVASRLTEEQQLAMAIAASLRESSAAANDDHNTDEGQDAEGDGDDEQENHSTDE